MVNGTWKFVMMRPPETRPLGPKGERMTPESKQGHPENVTDMKVHQTSSGFAYLCTHCH